ncbi:hypothetical protein DV515_00016005 [Chloebia gouldiae]|uniref:Peptidoglycan recognition protein family domain-containing protein n=1 Tax=Chloebia gouldiae TaxID=44316 RepID=A0A3L8RTY5_CHLGU|nr:hypothetical protein DV515_00016005 [Chloebia gouldiae]
MQVTAISEQAGDSTRVSVTQGVTWPGDIVPWHILVASSSPQVWQHCPWCVSWWHCVPSSLYVPIPSMCPCPFPCLPVAFPVFPPPHVSLSLSVSPCCFLCVPVPLPRVPALGLCPTGCPCVPQGVPVSCRVSLWSTGCPHVPQGVAMSCRMFPWLFLALSVCAHPRRGKDTPWHPTTPQDTFFPLILGSQFWVLSPWFGSFHLIWGPFPLVWAPSPYFGSFPPLLGPFPPIWGALPLLVAHFLVPPPPPTPSPTLNPPHPLPLVPPGMFQAVSPVVPPRHMDSVLDILDALESPTRGGSPGTAAALGRGLGVCSTPGCRAVLGEPLGNPERPPALTPGQWQLLTELLHHDPATLELGAVLAPDGSTVALGPLLAGIEAGLRSGGFGQPLPTLDPPADPLLAVTIAEALGTSFLLAQGGDNNTTALGPGGCWDDVENPQNYTLRGPPSPVPDPVAIGAMDGVVLGEQLAREPLLVAELLRGYYGTGNVSEARRPPSSYRRQVFRALVGQGRLEKEVAAVLGLLRTLSPTSELLRNVGKQEGGTGVQRALRGYGGSGDISSPLSPHGYQGAPCSLVDFTVSPSSLMSPCGLCHVPKDLSSPLSPGGLYHVPKELLSPLSLCGLYCVPIKPHVPPWPLPCPQDLRGHLHPVVPAECPAIVPRCLWGAQPYRGTPALLQLPLGSVFLHHTLEPSQPCRTFSACTHAMRNMQRFHQDTRGWDDIGYRQWHLPQALAPPVGASHCTSVGTVTSIGSHLPWAMSSSVVSIISLILVIPPVPFIVPLPCHLPWDCHFTPVGTVSRTIPITSPGSCHCTLLGTVTSTSSCHTPIGLVFVSPWSLSTPMVTVIPCGPHHCPLAVHVVVPSQTPPLSSHSPQHCPPMPPLLSPHSPHHCPFPVPILPHHCPPAVPIPVDPQSPISISPSPPPLSPHWPYHCPLTVPIPVPLQSPPLSPYCPHHCPLVIPITVSPLSPSLSLCSPYHCPLQSPPLYPTVPSLPSCPCSFAVGSDGYLYEGRGWHWVGAHTKGYNTQGFGVSIIGDFTATLPDPDTLALVRDELLPCAVRSGHIRPDFTLRGHRQLGHTDCPGNALFQEIQSWPSFQGTPVALGLRVGGLVGLVGRGLGEEQLQPGSLGWMEAGEVGKWSRWTPAQSGWTLPDVGPDEHQTHGSQLDSGLQPLSLQPPAQMTTSPATPWPTSPQARGNLRHTLGWTLGATLEMPTTPLQNEHPAPKLAPAASQAPQLSFWRDSRSNHDPAVSLRGNPRCPPGVTGMSPAGTAASPPRAAAEKEEEVKGRCRYAGTSHRLTFWTVSHTRSHGEATIGMGTKRKCSSGCTLGTGQEGHGDSPQDPVGGCCGQDSMGDMGSHSIIRGMQGAGSGMGGPQKGCHSPCKMWATHPTCGEGVLWCHCAPCAEWVTKGGSGGPQGAEDTGEVRPGRNRNASGVAGHPSPCSPGTLSPAGVGAMRGWGGGYEGLAWAPTEYGPPGVGQKNPKNLCPLDRQGYPREVGHQKLGTSQGGDAKLGMSTSQCPMILPIPTPLTPFQGSPKCLPSFH